MSFCTNRILACNEHLSLKLCLSLTGPAMMTVWSKAMLLTASCPSPLTRFKSRASGKFASDLGLGMVFARYSSFLHHNWLVTA